MTTRITQPQLESYLWGAATLLRGTIDAGDYQQFIVYGTPPQGRADYAFWQHILASLDPQRGRCAILFPHGVLFRLEEAEMRRKLIEADVIEAVVGLGPNLFYNSPMEACVVVCRARKPQARRGKILFINAVNEVTRERAQSFLTDEHIARIAGAYERLEDEPGFARVATRDEIRSRAGNLSIPLYVSANGQQAMGQGDHRAALAEALDAWLVLRLAVAEALRAILPDLPMPADDVVAGALNDVALFDREGWERMRFGDVVDSVNETERDPAEAGIERFIGLEHLEPGSLHIRSWGNVADGTTFTRRCRPGQTLFGKRRTYQRKVAVAEFDAVVSGDIYVLAPKNDRLVPDLLPFLCTSERFFQYAVETSAGSLSPRTNWTHLAKFEFDLPPLEQQRRIAELLWAVDEVECCYNALWGTIGRARTSLVDETIEAFWERVTSASLPVRRLDELLDEPISNGIFKKRDDFGRGTLLVNVTDIYGGFRVDPSTLERAETARDEAERFSARYGDVIFNRSSLVMSGIGHACFIPEWNEPMVFECHLMRARPDPRYIEPRFLCRYALSKRGRDYLVSHAQTTTMTTINQGDLGGMPIPLPSLGEQRALADTIDEWDETRKQAQKVADGARTLKTDMVNCLLVQT